MNQVIKNHQVCVLGIKEDNVYNLFKELDKYSSNNTLIFSNFEQKKNNIYFSIHGSFDHIKEFMETFAPKWDIREMDMSEFVRIMELSEEESYEWKSLSQQYLQLIMKKEQFETSILSKIIKINDIVKLEFLDKYFQGNVSCLIKERINLLKGEKDSYTLHLDSLMMKESILNYINSLDINSETVEISVEKLKEFKSLINL